MVDKEQITELLHRQFNFYGEVEIEDDGVVNVTGGMEIKGLPNVDHLLVQFGEVTSYFNIGSAHLSTLKGCPHTVGGVFNCRYNRLTSLEHGPTRVVGSYTAYGNPLKNLQHLAPEIGGWVEVDWDENLPLLRTLTARSGVILSPSDSTGARNVENIMNDDRWTGKGKKGSLMCAAALIRAGFEGNAKW